MIKNIRSLLVSIAIVLAFGFTVETIAETADNVVETIIVNVTEARVRNAPSLSAKVLGATKLGTVYTISGKRGTWYNISFTEGLNGWISATVVEPFDKTRNLSIYQKIAEKYINRRTLDFDTASELFDFLSNIRSEVVDTGAEPSLAYYRLVALAAALEAIPYDKIDKAPYKIFAAANENDVVYSEPAGQYFVNTERFWDLREKYSALPIAEEIAWKGSQINLPGECEGYVVCHLYGLRETTAKYLEYYPIGKHSKESLKNISEYLEYIAADANNSEDTGYYITSEPDDRVQLEEHVAQLREIVSKTSGPLKTKILGYLDQIETGYQPSDDSLADDPEFLEFWGRFKAAVIKKDKNAVAGMTKFPFSMPFGLQPIKTKAEFLRRYDTVFYGETDAAKCFVNAELTNTGIYCGFKNALEDTNKPIKYYFENTPTGWKLAGLDNINE